MDHRDFPDTENIDSFALYKGFTLFEIVNELVTKEEPLCFNPPNLARNIAEPKSKKKGTSDSKGNATMKYRFHFKSFASFLEGIDDEDLREVMDNFAAKRLSLSTQVTRNTQYTSYVPFYGVAPWKQQHLLPIALVPLHPYCLNMPQYMPPTEL
jgi:hypothetical protein